MSNEATLTQAQREAFWARQEGWTRRCRSSSGARSNRNGTTRRSSWRSSTASDQPPGTHPHRNTFPSRGPCPVSAGTGLQHPRPLRAEPRRCRPPPHPDERTEGQQPVRRVRLRVRPRRIPPDATAHHRRRQGRHRPQGRRGRLRLRTPRLPPPPSRACTTRNRGRPRRPTPRLLRHRPSRPVRARPDSSRSPGCAGTTTTHPTGWDYTTFQQFNNGRPDVVFMAYNPAAIGSKYTKTAAKYVDNYDTGIESARNYSSLRPSAPSPEER